MGCSSSTQNLSSSCEIVNGTEFRNEHGWLMSLQALPLPLRRIMWNYCKPSKHPQILLVHQLKDSLIDYHEIREGRLLVILRYRMYLLCTTHNQILSEIVFNV